MIIQSGIREVVYISDKYKDSNSMQASRRMMDMAGVSYFVIDVSFCITNLVSLCCVMYS